ncbi:hypothetical protein BKI52_20625 [marine bacterium AO1-C]|nr:hypothetical protein BKI52_20625 [marine bacterium AO1-C]
MSEQNLIIKENYTLEELKDVIARGGKFVVFQYCYSFFLITFRVMTSPILVIDEEERSKYQRRYNLISSLLGWWAIPMGPFRTLSCIKVNSKGGLDVTNDIMLNLTEEGLQNRRVEVVLVNDVFEKPDKWELKAFQKSLVKKFETDPCVAQIVVGLHVNKPKEEIRPTYIVGILAKERFEKYAEDFGVALGKEFRKHVQFEFIDLHQQDELQLLLLEQGLPLLDRKL